MPHNVVANILDWLWNKNNKKNWNLNNIYFTPHSDLCLLLLIERWWLHLISWHFKTNQFVSYSLCTSRLETNTTEISTRLIFEDRIKMRQNLFLALIQGVSKVIQVYANNLVCMDLCGTSKQQARRLTRRTTASSSLGPASSLSTASLESTSVIDMLEEEFENGRIWGCRHDLG